MAKKNINENPGGTDFDSVMESQIGQLGKLDSRVTSGGSRGIEALTDEERASMEAFLERGRKNDRSRKVVDFDNPTTENIPSIGSDGWIPLNIEQEMGYERSQFYPSDWKFFIKPAPVNAIKNWISVNEEDPRAVYNVLNEILRTSVKVIKDYDEETGKGTTIGWSKINTWDRFWFILKVREITFVTGESKITFEDECTNCAQPITYELKSDSLHFDIPDEDIITKHWSQEENKWIIDVEEYGLTQEDLPVEFSGVGMVELYIPKVGTDNMIIEWASAKAAQAKSQNVVDETFVKFLSWLCNPRTTPKVQTDFNKWVEKVHKNYRMWSETFFEFINDVVTNISINQSETLKQVCPSCEEEAVSTVKFPNGIAQLFKSTTGNSRIKKFGSR